MRIGNLQKQIASGRRALSIEREQQRRKKESERMAKSTKPTLPRSYWLKCNTRGYWFC